MLSRLSTYFTAVFVNAAFAHSSGSCCALFRKSGLEVVGSSLSIDQLPPHPNGCWNTCDGKPGYCSKCDSIQGDRGVCCKKRAGEDPVECKRVPDARFKHPAYHECVIAGKGVSILP